ncbi:hypothetical protein Tco_0427229, partial [Tanacetum coccineum]
MGRLCICLWTNSILSGQYYLNGCYATGSYCRDVVVAGNIIQTIQTGLRQSYECLASAP